MILRTGAVVLLTGWFSVSCLSAAEGATTENGGGWPVERIRTYGDTESIEVGEELSAFLNQNQGLIGSVARKAVTFDQAIARARAMARKATDARAVQALRARLPAGGDADAYRLLAAREALTGNIEAAFCLLVFAYDSDPSRADGLSDLAGLLASLGYANEALAVLDELARRKAQPTPPMGIAAEDVVDTTRGYALLRLGDQAGARKKLEAVRARQPLLSEAPRLLALLDAKEDKDPRKNFILGLWRHRAQVARSTGVDVTKEEPDPFETDEDLDNDEIAIDVRSLVDLSKGEEGRLPNVPFAATPEQANGMIPAWEARMTVEDKEHQALTARRNQATPRRFRHTEDDVQEVWGYTVEKLLISLDYRDARLRDLERAIREADRESRDAYRRIERERDDRAHEALLALAQRLQRSPTLHEIAQVHRLFFDSALGQGRGPAMKMEKALRDWFAEWHLLASALAGEVGDPQWREVYRCRIEAQRSSYFSRLLHEARMHAALGASVIFEIQPGDEAGDKDEQGMGNCDGDQSIGISVNSLGAGEVSPVDLGVEMTCEGLSLEAGVSVLPGLQVSGEVAMDKKGGYSVFVGPKIDATIKGTGASVKTGFTVSGSRGQGVTGIGAKMETKASVAAGAVSRSTKLSEQSMSFMPAPQTSPPGDLSLPRW